MSSTKEKNHDEICEGLASSNKITLEEILKLHKVKFTKPQQAIVDRLLKGQRLLRVNKHLPTSVFKWKKPDSEYLEETGSVYKAFWNIEYTVYKQTKISLSMGQYIIQ